MGAWIDRFGGDVAVPDVPGGEDRTTGDGGADRSRSGGRRGTRIGTSDRSAGSGGPGSASTAGEGEREDDAGGGPHRQYGRPSAGTRAAWPSPHRVDEGLHRGERLLGFLLVRRMSAPFEQRS